MKLPSELRLRLDVSISLLFPHDCKVRTRTTLPFLTKDTNSENTQRRMIEFMNCERNRMWKEAGVARFMVLFWYMLGWMGKSQKSSFRTSAIPAGFRRK
jgi:hypothetical protein